MRVRAASFNQYHVYLAARRIARQHRLRSVIDLGCGPATKTIELLKPVCERVVGIDLEGVTRLCTQRYSGVEFYTANLEDPSLDLLAANLAAQFDLIICADVIEHLAVPDVLIEYVSRVARDGAFLVMSTPERDILRGPDCMTCPKPQHVREWNEAEFSRYLVSRGLEIAEHELLPVQRFNLSRTYLKAFTRSLRWRRSFRSCQMVVCRVWKQKIQLSDS